MLAAGYPCGSISRIVILPPDRSLTSDFYKKNALSIDEFLKMIAKEVM